MKVGGTLGDGSTREREREREIEREREGSDYSGFIPSSYLSPLSSSLSSLHSSPSLPYCAIALEDYEPERESERESERQRETERGGERERDRETETERERERDTSTELRLVAGDTLVILREGQGEGAGWVFGRSRRGKGWLPADWIEKVD